MSSPDTVRSTWLRLDEELFKNLCTFYTTWRAAEHLSTNSWNGVKNLSASCSTKERNYCPPPSRDCYRSRTDAADLWTQGPTFVFLQNEIWQVLLLSGTESTTPRRLEVLLLEVFNLDRFLV